MLRAEIHRLLQATPRDLRKFGLMVGGVCGALGLWFLFRHKPYYSYFLFPGALLMAFGVVWPRALKWIYIFWMALGLGLGLIISPLVLTALFYCVVTPIGLLARVCGRDFLSRKPDPNASSHWRPRPAKKKITSNSFEGRRHPALDWRRVVVPTGG